MEEAPVAAAAGAFFMSAYPDIFRRSGPATKLSSRNHHDGVNQHPAWPFSGFIIDKEAPMRKLIIASAAAFALAGVAACSSPAEKAADSQADAIQATGEATAEKLEADARATQAQAEAAADRVKADAEAKADAVKDAANH